MCGASLATGATGFPGVRPHGVGRVPRQGAPRPPGQGHPCCNPRPGWALIRFVRHAAVGVRRQGATAPHGTGGPPGATAPQGRRASVRRHGTPGPGVRRQGDMTRQGPGCAGTATGAASRRDGASTGVGGALTWGWACASIIPCHCCWLPPVAGAHASNIHGPRALARSPRPRRGAFAQEVRRRHAWFLQRDAILPAILSPGSLPLGWPARSVGPPSRRPGGRTAPGGGAGPPKGALRGGGRL